MKNDINIAQAAALLPAREMAGRLDFETDDVDLVDGEIVGLF